MTKAREGDRAVDFSRSNVARYIQLATLFRRRMESGEWAVGQQIPTIDVLMRECGVARETVRQALGVLERENWIDRFRAKGTFVRARPQLNSLLDISADFSGLFWAPEGLTIEIKSVTENVPLPTLPDIVGEVLSTYVHQQKVHWHSGIPFLVTENYYDPAVYEKITLREWQTKGVLAILKDHPEVAFADARQVLTISSADIETAAHLQLPLNAPVARVQRFVIDTGGRVIFFGDGLYRGENVRLDISLK